MARLRREFYVVQRAGLRPAPTSPDFHGARAPWNLLVVFAVFATEIQAGFFSGY